MKVYPHVAQGSEEWFAMRKGRPTASRFDMIITAKTGEPSKSRHDYMCELIAECFCPEFTAFMGNSWTDRGQELEPQARDAFAQTTGLDLEHVGFVTRDDNIVGCSPDSLIRDTKREYIAGLEIKCPSPKNHVAYVLADKLPDEYRQQVHGGMAVTGLNVWHFWSYYPGLKPLHVIVHRDSYTEKLSAALDQFVIDYAAAREKALPKLSLKLAQ